MVANPSPTFGRTIPTVPNGVRVLEWDCGTVWPKLPPGGPVEPIHLGMNRNLIAALLSAAFLSLPLWAQFDNLVTSDDGSTVLFQSQWRLAGSGDGNLSKIYRWDSRGFTSVFSPVNPGLIAPPSATSPVITGDGAISGYLKYSGCSGNACSTNLYVPVLSGATLPSALAPDASLQISRSGRYLASGNTVLDRNTGTLQVVAAAGSGLAVGGRFGIGNNGGLLYVVVRKVFVISTVDLVLSSRPATTIVNSSAVYTAVVSAAENRVVYEISGNTSLIGRQLWSYDMNSGQSSKLEDFDFGTLIGLSQYQPTISNDGMRLVYRRKNPVSQEWEAVLRDYAAGTTTVLGQILASRGNFTITGDGKSAWIHGSDGRLVRIAIDTLAATDAGGRHAWVSQRTGAAVFGSYNHLFGGFPAGGRLGSPANLRVDLSGLDCPLLSASTQELGVQIPWEIRPGNLTITLRNSSSPFESVLAVNVVDLAPTFERGGLPSDSDPPVIVVHQDFLSLVTQRNPAVAGETVHLYMTGLGDVQPRPATGQTSVPLAVVSQRPFCSLVSAFPQSEAIAPVVFAGIAPGMIGIYQMDITIPVGYPPSLAALECFDRSDSGLTGDYTFIDIVGAR
jgi:uncharacterized protein (TIGR03437 family)